jgi:hypothetical protein
MAGKPKSPRAGTAVRRPPGAFPLYCDGRKPSVVTADPWSFLRHIAITSLAKAQETRALAYLDQARDFFDSANNPRLGSKPLLYYYAFMNLAKYALVVEGHTLPQKLQHGISDPRANSKKQVKLSGQRVQWDGCAQDGSKLFAEFLAMLHGSALPNGSRTVRSLLRQIPTVHRTFCLVTKERNALLPIHSTFLLQGRGELWARFSVRRSDAEAEKILERISRRQGFRRALTRVSSERDEEIWLETVSVKAVKKGVDNGIRALASKLAPLGLNSILTSTGYRLYLTDIAPAQRLPQLAVSYAVMFYLGSVTRYRPHEFDRIVSGSESWIVGEYFSTQPTQFIYALCSFLSGRAVHRPYAV